jgi:hypothetical protein
MTDRCCDCAGNTDPLKLVREGADQVKRALAAPDPARVPVDERRPEHAMVFATAYAKHLKYFDLGDNEQGDWEAFFTSDVSAQLAVIAIEDVAVYRSTVKGLLHSLEDPDLPASGPRMISALGAVFDCIGTLARRIDTIQAQLPADQPLRATLSNLIRSQLSPALRRLIGYHLAGAALGVVDRQAAPPAGILILGGAVEPFDALLSGQGLAAIEWPDGAGLAGWSAYAAVDPEEYKGAYGPSVRAVDRVNHLATHNLFTAACERFLAVHARVVDEAKAAVQASFESNGHEPHYALFLAFLRLFEYARDEANTLTGRHLDFYYRNVLQLQKRPAQPGHAHVLVELAKHVDDHLLAQGTRLKAGKDDAGADAHFAVDRDLVANKATVAELKRVYRHPSTDPLLIDHDRIFASPAIDAGGSWHPFAEKVFVDGALKAIGMPHAALGFAIASHYLWMAEGKRIVHVHVDTDHVPADDQKGLRVDLLCRLTTAKGWLDKQVNWLDAGGGGLNLDLELDGNDPPVTPYDPAIHGHGFGTSLPVLLVQLNHRINAAWDYPALEDVKVRGITLSVAVDGVKTLALSNDHGPLDGAKPFLPYGSSPVAGSALLIGSKEVFQKSPATVTVRATEMVSPVASGPEPTVSADYLLNGGWMDADLTEKSDPFEYVVSGLRQPAPDTPDLTPDTAYATATRAGFIRLVLSGGFGTDTYPLDLAKWISGRLEKEPQAPVLPMFGSLTLNYTATQEIDLREPSEGRGRFIHVAPFGHAEATFVSGQSSVPLLPLFRAGAHPAEGELYIGVRDLHPPQNLALLFQVVDGTVNPLVVKPEHHIDWTYLRGNEWAPFAAGAVADGTDGLLASGIVTLAVPDDASTGHTLLPSGVHWIRLAVASASEAVCRLETVAAQALRATYEVPGNGSTSRTSELPPGTITKLDPPVAAVKGVSQPFPTFGGRPLETDGAFAARASERLRHKDRAITLWDYEHLILEAFPAIFQARCLNHTQYEPSSSGSGVYRELAAGHVTVVTIPDLTVPNPRDPLRPFTSLGVLGEIERFLARRMPCFARLHVRNPQFEEVRVDLRVRFRPGVDETFHINKLKREITQFLSPWAFGGDARPSFNGTVHKSVLVNFVEERTYVDFVSDVRLFRRLPGVTSDGPDLEEVAGSRAISILVSTPPEQHGVHPIHPDEVPVPEHCDCATVAV